MSRRTRRGPSGPPRCNRCKAPIAFFVSPFAPGKRPFNPTALDGHRAPPGSFPIFGRKAYRLVELVEVLQVQRETTAAAAEQEARDMPWHTLHACPADTGPTTPEEGP